MKWPMIIGVKSIMMCCLVFGMVMLQSCLTASSHTSDTRSGELVIPGKTDDGDDDKKCIRVCEKWTKKCDIQINPTDTGGGSSARKCRRSCAKFGKYCE